MTCPNCGTEIADKALICYRCGEPSAAPRQRPPAREARRSSVPAALALVVLLIAALFMGRTLEGDVPRIIGYVVAALAAVAVAWRVVAARRR